MNNIFLGNIHLAFKILRIELYMNFYENCVGGGCLFVPGCLDLK